MKNIKKHAILPQFFRYLNKYIHVYAFTKPASDSGDFLLQNKTFLSFYEHSVRKTTTLLHLQHQKSAFSIQI